MENKNILKVKCESNCEDLRKRIHNIEIIDNPLLPKFKVQVPVSFKGPQEGNLGIHCTPEHYYLSAVASCFSTTFSVIASNSNMIYNDIEILTKASIKDVSTGKIIDKIFQKITLKIPKSIPREKAKKVLKSTQNACPIANSIRTKVKNDFKIIQE